MRLPADLADERTTPNFVFITPNLCDDGHDGSGTGAAGTTCANGQPGGLTSADAFLQTWVPKIMASPAYKQDGLLIITFDESNYTENVAGTQRTKQTTVSITFPGETCCGQQEGPNLRGSTRNLHLAQQPESGREIVFNGYGGDQVGAVLLSPFVKPGQHLGHWVQPLFTASEPRGYLPASRASRLCGRQSGLEYFLDTLGNDENVFRRESRS